MRLWDEHLFIFTDCNHYIGRLAVFGRNHIVTRLSSPYQLDQAFNALGSVLMQSVR